MYPGRRTLLPTPPTRIELHAHLEASMRHETIWELLRAKKMRIPGDGTFHGLQEALVVKDPVDYGQILQPYFICIPAIAGDLEAIERVAFEFCEDKAHQGVLYAEVRYSPHYLLRTKLSRGMLKELGEVVKAVHRGFERAERLQGIIARSILCMVNNMGVANDIIHLCEKYRDSGVVGMDIMAPIDIRAREYEEVPLAAEELQAFLKASRLGIHRTVHAGEVGGHVMVRRALENYRAERLGHGYAVLQDQTLYTWCRENDIHFECCPWSSYVKGTVQPNVAKHPVARFAEDQVNFSLSSDIPSFTGFTLQDDYDLASSWGLTETHLVRSNINALRSSFLSPEEKDKLNERLLRYLGLNERRP